MYNPYLEEFYYAQKGREPTATARLSMYPRASGAGNRDLRHCAILSGVCGPTFALARKFFDKALDLRRSGSAAIDLCNVAAGRAELYFECVLSPWDFAAGSLIVEEAGGKVTTLDGGPLTLEKKCSVLATNGVVEKI